MVEVRFHGRGGQGTVIASKLLAIAVAAEGKYVQAFPEFGVERRGAPVTAFLRIDDKRIYEKYRIYEPNHLVVLDPTLVGVVDVTGGLRRDGWVIINTTKKPEELPAMAGFQVATIDATGIALKHHLGSRTAPIVNTAILGAVVRALKFCRLRSLLDAIREEAPLKKEENAAAAAESYDLTRGVKHAAA